MPSRLPSPSSPTLATSSGWPKKILGRAAILPARGATASRAAKAGRPLSRDARAAINGPSGFHRDVVLVTRSDSTVVQGMRGQRDIRAVALDGDIHVCRAVEMRHPHPQGAESVPGTQAARSCSRNVGAGTAAKLASASHDSTASRA